MTTAHDQKMGIGEIKELIGHVAGLKAGEKVDEKLEQWKQEFIGRLKDVETRIGQTVVNAPEGGEGRIKFHPQNEKHPYVQDNWARIQNDRIKVKGRLNDTVDTRGAGLLFARLVRANVLANNKGHKDVRKILKGWNDDWMIRDLDVQAEKVMGSVDKAMGADVFETGGALIPPDFVATFVEALRPMVVTRMAGAQEIDMPNGNATFSRQTGTSTLQYAPEGSNVAATGLRFDQVRLISKELRGVVPLSNNLLAHASATADVRIRNDLTVKLGEREDAAFLRGDGRLNSPLGMRFRGTDAAGNPGIDAAAVVANIKSLLTTMALRNVTSSNFALIMNPRTRINAQWVTADTATGFLFRQEIGEGMIAGIPWFETTQIPNNLSTPVANSSEMILCAMDEFYIGDQTMAEMEFFPGGAYWDGTQVQSGISRNESVITIVARHDCNLTRPEYCHTLNGIVL